MKTEKGSIVLVTGASSGIGKMTALQLAKEGYVVYAGARRLELMEKELKPMGIHILSLDVCDDDSLKKAVDKIIGEQGRVDVLINNAGYGSYGAIEDVPLSEAKRQFEVNIFGLARLTQLVTPYMRRENFGKVVNVSSIGGKIYSLFGGWYHATKYALEGLSDCLRLELKPFGIDVIVIEPGIIRTEWMDISCENLLKTSESNVYAPLAKKAVNAFKKLNSRGSDPQLIADTISEALKTDKPKTRYARGSMSRLFLLARKLLSDKVMDKLTFSMFKYGDKG